MIPTAILAAVSAGGFVAGFVFAGRCLRLGLAAHVSGRRHSPNADRLAAILTAAAARNARPRPEGDA